jgi:RHS repeat-associated protein
VYRYDAFGRRIEKNVNGDILRFTYAGDQIVAEHDGAGTLLAKYIFGVGIDEAFRMEAGASQCYFHGDGLGSVCSLTDSFGTKVESHNYSAYGEMHNTTTPTGNRFMFTGREYDSEARIHHYRYRRYVSERGAFSEPDPLRKYLWLLYGRDTSLQYLLVNNNLVGSDLRGSLYAYCGNNPVTFVDPFGLSTKEPWYNNVPVGDIMNTGGEVVSTAGVIVGSAGMAFGGAAASGLGAGVGAVETARELEPLYTNYYKGSLRGTEYEYMLEYTPEQIRQRKQLRKSIWHYLFNLNPD